MRCDAMLTWSLLIIMMSMMPACLPEVGNFKGPNNLTESKTHFGGWCIVSAPLILGMDVTDKENLDAVWPIISNTEAIAVNQAWAGHPGRLVEEGGPHDPAPAGPRAYQVWAKKMPDGGQAVFVVNQSPGELSQIKVELTTLGLPATAKARDIWAKKDIGTVEGTWAIATLASHDSMFVRFSNA
jgi:hypothetical protein